MCINYEASGVAALWQILPTILSNSNISISSTYPRLYTHRQTMQWVKKYILLWLVIVLNRQISWHCFYARTNACLWWIYDAVMTHIFASEILWIFQQRAVANVIQLCTQICIVHRFDLWWTWYVRKYAKMFWTFFCNVFNVSKSCVAFIHRINHKCTRQMFV